MPGTNGSGQVALNNKVTVMVFGCVQAMILGLSSWLWTEFDDLREEVIERRQMMSAIEKVDIKVEKMVMEITELKIASRAGPEWMRDLIRKHDSDLENVKEDIAELKRR